MNQRRAGLLLHPTSLPGRFAIGDLGPAVDRLLDWMTRAGLSIWQVLPLGPPTIYGSPYDSLSAFAGNPLLISPERLLADGLLTPEDLDAPSGSDNRVDFAKVATWKRTLLRQSWERFRDIPGPLHDEMTAFQTAEAQRSWLADWTLFSALKERFPGQSWCEWPAPLRDRKPTALEVARQELADELDYHGYLQFQFFRQWQRVRDEAARRGILLLGDLPIYVAHDSADVWSHRELFALAEDGRPAAVAGVPPDYFSPDGQRWGNPLYRWDVLAKNGHGWWIERVAANLRLADALRLDHFRGFEAYWQIPASEPTAVHGSWTPGPGTALFAALKDALGALPLIAEDLGDITPSVHELRAALGLPGMRVLQFGFDDAGSLHAPHHLSPKSVVYTGTHDNDTLLGWFRGLEPQKQQRVRDYAGAADADEARVVQAIVRLAFTSVARWMIIPAQDLLELGSEARMNTPGQALGNWVWRLPAGAFTDPLAERLRRLAELSDRLR